MAALLAVISAVLFALAATLQQRGQFVLARKGNAVEGVAGLLSLILVPAWLLGTAVLFGLSATFDKPVIDDLHTSLGDAATSLALLGLVGFGFIAFLIQQLSLATGQLAPAMAVVSVANPGVSAVLGILPYEERLTRPTWHVLVAIAALLVALAGATVIALANRETQMPGEVAPDEGARCDPALT